MIKNLVLDRKTPTAGIGDNTSTIRKCAEYCWKKYQATVCKASKTSSSSELEDTKSGVCKVDYRNPKIFDFSGDLFNQTEKIINEYNAEGKTIEETVKWRWDNLHIRINPEAKK